MTRSFGRPLAAECDRKAGTVVVFAGRNCQFSAYLLHQFGYDFHSKTFAPSGIESLRQSRPIIQYR